MSMRFRLRKDTEFVNPAFVFMLRLLMGRDSLLSGFRWIDSLENQDTFYSQTDRQLAVITAMGWASEVVRRIRQGNAKGWISRTMLGPDAEMLSLFDEVLQTKPDSEMIGRLMRIRDKCAFHWDEEIAEAFLSNAVIPPGLTPVFELADDSDFQKSRSPWALGAVALELIGNDSEGEKLHAFLSDAKRYVGKITELATRLAVGIIKKNGAKLEDAAEGT